jgi:hypothetical protein
MFLVYITLALISLGVAAFVWGAISLAKFGFRISVPVGLAVLLFPPYTFYFAFFRLEEEGKELPTAGWLCGLIVSVLLSLMFLPTLQHVFAGEWDQLGNVSGPGEVASSSQNNDSSASSSEAESDDESGDDEQAQTDSAPTGPDAGGTSTSSDATSGSPDANSEGSG